MGEGSRYNCTGCGNQFILKWRKDQRDYIFIDLADIGKGEPLGIPRGSVRAIVTLTISITIWAMFVLDRMNPDYMLNLALIMIGYYFAFRVITSPLKGIPDVIEAGTKQPLYMPKGVIRWVLICGFLLAGGFVVVRGDLIRADLVEFYTILIGMTIGYASRKLVIEKFKIETPMWMKNTKSIIVICMALYMQAIFSFALADDVPIFTIRTSIALIGFYFGSRN